MKFNINNFFEISAEELEKIYSNTGDFSQFKRKFQSDLIRNGTWTSPSLQALDATMFSLISEIQNPKIEKFFIEAGANNGLRQSNSFVFEQCFGWKGLLVEPIKYNYDLCKKYRGQKSKCLHACISSYDGKITGAFADILEQERIENDHGLGAGCTEEHKRIYPNLIKEVDCFKYETICKINSIPRNYALLCLDVERHEREIIDDKCFQHYRPALICIETDNKTVINDIVSQDYLLLKTIDHNFFLGDKTI